MAHADTAAYIAAVNPATILALIAEIERLRELVGANSSLSSCGYSLIKETMMKTKNQDKDWFAEKEAQVEPSCITAFSIQCVSRYGTAHEIIDMIKFCQQCASKRVNQYVTSLFYDGQSCCCTIEYDKDETIKNHAHRIIRQIADSSLGQHDMDDCIGGYATLDDGFEAELEQMNPHKETCAECGDVEAELKFEIERLNKEADWLAA